MSASQHVVLNVPDISCGHCKMAIEKALDGLAGIESVSVDVEAKSVDVRLDRDAITLEAVKAAIADEGYGVAGEHVFED
jgi:copper chaperone